MSQNNPSRAELLFEKQGGCCYYCGVEMFIPPKNRLLHRLPNKLKAATKEHLHRRVDGGGDEDDNIVLACMKCNSTRDYHPPHLWRNESFRARVNRYRSIRKITKSRQRTRVAKMRKRFWYNVEKLDSMFSSRLTIIFG